jgi:M6 family metalloprotease-like protein/uncharacterized repeat protein (TIGR02543 family)
MVLFFLGSCQLNPSITLSFDTNGGNNIPDLTLDLGDDLVLPEQPQKQGYDFSGWYMDEQLSLDLDEASIFDLSIDQKITLYAKWEAIIYQITYVLDGGINPENQVLTYTIEDEVTLSQPIKIGYTFQGWFLEASLTNPQTSTFSNTTGDLTLYAKWEEVTENTYTIVFQNYDGTTLETDLVLEGVLPTFDGLTPTRPDTETHTYTFIGWNPEIAVATSNQIYVATYSETPIENDDLFDPTELNTIFGFDIYAQMPIINEDDYLILDFGDSTWFEVYIDIFSWTDQESDLYIDLLDEAFAWDSVEESWIIGSFYIYVYEDAFSYPPDVVYGIGIYGDKEGSVNPSEPFDPDDLNTIFGFDIYSLMPSFTSEDVLILNYSDHVNYEVYIDIFDWTSTDSDDYIDLLDLALTYDDIEESWVLGDYFIYVYEDTQSYPGEIVFGIGIYGAIPEILIYETWNDMMAVLKVNLGEPSLDTLIPVFDSLINISLVEINNDAYHILGTLDTLDIEQAFIDYLNDVLSKGFTYDTELSLIKEGDVYSYEVNDDLAYALYWTIDQSELTIQVWSFDPVIDTSTLSSLSVRQSINSYEKTMFGQSGLPSVGTFDVLVIPIEINGTPFPSDYLAKLDLVFNGTPLMTGWESVASYYQKSSYGLLNLTFDISQKFVTSNPKSYYENIGSDGDQYAIVEALNGLNDTIDYSQYDDNLDGLIDSVIFIYSVEYSYDVEPWWAWVFAAKYGEGANIDTLDGKGFEYFMWASYAFLEDGLPNVTNLVVNAETYIHELGHLMGAVDLYSYTHDYGPIGGMGMMDNNNGDHEPLHKMLFGWLQPLIAIEGTYQIDLESYSIDHDGLGSAIVVPYQTTDFDDGNAFDEFLIIMFYTPEGLYEAHQGLEYVLNQAAVIVYHVDARFFSNTTFWDGYFMYNNDGPSDFTSEILEVDKNNSLPSMGSPIQISDVLTSGIFDMSSYTWHQGGSIDVSIEVMSTITNGSDAVTLVISVND